jgi:hypothetical protein
MISPRGQIVNPLVLMINPNKITIVNPGNTEVGAPSWQIRHTEAHLLQGFDRR